MSGATAAQKGTFLATYGPQARAAGAALAVDPNLIYAQWATESGYGTNSQAAGFNVAGIMPGGSAGVYTSPADFETAYVGVIQHNDPQAIGAGSDAGQFVSGLQAGHYFGNDNAATYQANLSAIASTNPLGTSGSTVTGNPPAVGANPNTPDPLTGEPMGPQGQTTGSGVVSNPAGGPGILSGAWNVIGRGMLMLFGIVLIGLAVGAMLFDAKTVQSTLGTLRA